MWDSYWFDPQFFRKEEESRRIATAWLDGEPRGYATFRRKGAWDQTGPTGTVVVYDLVALDAAAALALWRVLTDLDLTTKVEARKLPTDDAVLRLLVDPRAVVPKLSDNLWVRIIDVPAALAGRRYATDVDVVLHVTDARIPGNEGRWHLRAPAFGPATAERTTAAADLSLDVRELGEIYLGGPTLAALAASGLVTEHRPGSLAAAAVAFTWPVAPQCSFHFEPTHPQPHPPTMCPPR
jgi:predicted acetyltransferase